MRFDPSLVHYVSIRAQKVLSHNVAGFTLGKEVNTMMSGAAKALSFDLIVMLGLLDEVIDMMTTKVEALEGDLSAEAAEVIASVGAAVDALEDA